MSQPTELNLTQQLELKNLEYQLQRMSPQQMRELCLKFFEQNLQLQNATKEMFASKFLNGEEQ